MSPDLRCTLVTSGADARTVDIAATAAAAGAGVVQVRAKGATARTSLDLTCAIAAQVQRANPASLQPESRASPPSGR
jgi:thiamine-phosphate pyrophosphorylase